MLILRLPTSRQGSSTTHNFDRSFHRGPDEWDVSATPSFVLSRELAKQSLTFAEIVKVDGVLVKGLFGSGKHEPMAIAKGLTDRSDIVKSMKKWKPSTVPKAQRWGWGTIEQDDFLKYVEQMAEFLFTEYTVEFLYHMHVIKW